MVQLREPGWHPKSDATFDRFSELPPEIRQQIFRLYFDSFGERPREFLGPAGQPPITLASKQTRQEALPLFYSRCQFLFFHFRREPRFSRTNEAFLHNTTTHDFARIRFLCLRFFPEADRDTYIIHVTININDDECPVKVVSSCFERDNRFKNLGGLDTKLNESLMLEPRTLIRGIAAREGCMKLRKDDMLLLSESLERALERGLKKDK